ncbi:hypothetical protein T484DRAFT_1933733, partial [Baffinella frigidus]
NELGDQGVRVLLSALDKHPTITALDFEDNRVGDYGAEALLLGLQGALPALTSLDARLHRMSPPVVEALRQAALDKPCALSL